MGTRRNGGKHGITIIAGLISLTYTLKQSLIERSGAHILNSEGLNVYYFSVFTWHFTLSHAHLFRTEKNKTNNSQIFPTDIPQCCLSVLKMSKHSYEQLHD